MNAVEEGTDILNCLNMCARCPTGHQCVWGSVAPYLQLTLFIEKEGQLYYKTSFHNYNLLEIVIDLEGSPIKGSFVILTCLVLILPSLEVHLPW